jgi:hypothetical protein
MESNYDFSVSARQEEIKQNVRVPIHCWKRQKKAKVFWRVFRKKKKSI